MTTNDILELVRAGFTKEEIFTLANAQPAPQPAPEPAPAPDQTQVLQMVQQLTGNVDKLSKQLQALAIRDIAAHDLPKKATAEEILSQMLQPYKDIRGKEDNK